MAGLEDGKSEGQTDWRREGVGRPRSPERGRCGLLGGSWVRVCWTHEGLLPLSPPSPSGLLLLKPPHGGQSWAAGSCRLQGRGTARRAKPRPDSS